MNKNRNANRKNRGLGENNGGGVGVRTVTIQFCRHIHDIINPLETDRDLKNSERPGEREVHGTCKRQFIHNNFLLDGICRVFYREGKYFLV